MDGATGGAPAMHESSAPAENVVVMRAGTEALETYLRGIRPLLAGEVTEVCINRAGEAWTESRGGWHRHDMPTLTYSNLRQLAKLIANATSQSISEVTPIISAALPSGERVQAVIPPACESGTVSLTLRKPGANRFSLIDYEGMGFFEDVVLRKPGLEDFEVRLLELREARRFREFFELAVRNKQTILVTGATGSGKTTFMKALVDLVPEEERLITIEDVHELSLKQPNRVHLFYSKGGQGVAKVTAGGLLEACMRMKPDRIFPAELRDEAAYTFLIACNTGHPGSITSMHCNSETEAVPRFAALAAEAEAARTTPMELLQRRISDTIDIVAHVGKVNGQRRITGIAYDPERKRTPVG